MTVDISLVKNEFMDFHLLKGDNSKHWR